MNRIARFVVAALAIVVGLHYLLAFTHEGYAKATSFPLGKSSTTASPSTSESKDHRVLENVVSTPLNEGAHVDAFPTSPQLANATFIILCRNSDLASTIRSVREIEDRFNHRYGYPYVFLNEVPFTTQFQERLGNVVNKKSKVEFGVIPHEHWYQPDHIDEDKAKAGREKMQKDNVIYGGSVSYRNMCRFNSGFFFRHPLVQKYRWYWRIEPDVHFHCDINHDPFRYMEDHGKTYGFTITMYEYEATIQTLWSTVKSFMSKHPEYIAPDNALGFMEKEDGKYNLCHFWSNFEIADMDFWRGEAYTKFFEYLDEQGGFYYERWGDAPVHSIGAAIFLNRTQIHFFDEIGYEHNPYTHCPKLGTNWKDGRCSCDPAKSFDYDGYSCMAKWDKFMGLPNN
ncbi:alpha-1,2-mannosyltransferase [Coprinellus micaceus]|uniref:Alpha-1,2-mannosyltransferase n=1 Tax=Coprinellus micaceus TaxID=71717 RepID=A0A4Y7SX24_COPMI|nr:alpha-1,2-mannosyltransferase [Coprinellus micaceus]